MASVYEIQDRSLPKLGKCFLTVESVQELVKRQKETIPERYIRRDDEQPTPTSLSDHQLDVPIIDMTKLSEGHQREREIKKLAKACEDWGFFQVVNHGIPNSLLDGVKRVGKEFFQLPLEEKQKYAVKAGSLEGYGQRFVVSEDQKLDWGDLLGLLMFPSDNRDLSVWPLQPPDFREIADSYNTEIKRLAGKLLSLIAETLQLKLNFFERNFGKPYQRMRMNYYPPCPTPDHVFGLSPHANMTAITLLLQDDDVVGLNVRKNDQWIAVQPIPYVLVINVGNLIEVMSNGRYKSIEHRAMTNRSRARMSIGAFYAPEFEAEIGPAQELIDETHPRLFRNFIHEEYMKWYFSRGVEGKHSLYEFAGIRSTH
eukprot:PITA_12314